jgi:CrcB protein
VTALYVALGGAAGALARFALGGWVTRWAGPGFPWATFGINLAGSLLLGWLLRALPGHPAEVQLRALLTVGFCGAFTTFSTFGWETAELLRRGAHGTAAAYVGGSVVLSVVGVFAGAWLAARA